MANDRDDLQHGPDAANHDSSEPRDWRFPIVGIGASAGGLDALRTLFEAMPADTGIGFVVIQHLDAGHHSMLAELLSKYTAMPVVVVDNGSSVKPNRVYVIPPNTYLTISDGILLLKVPPEARGLRMPIDRFFCSLAGDQHEKAIGIVLSGTGTDGTLGVREIKANGGMALVQDPETAQYDGMPRSAIATGLAGEVPVRVWVPGCATGEEAYTLAILFAEAFDRAGKDTRLMVFATDVDTEALQVGREGIYQEHISASLSRERLRRFFTQEGDHFRVKHWLRDLVVFTPQNLIADPPFSKLDLISCRNLLIYLETRLQEEVLRLFHFALKPDGFLVLGSSETLGHQQVEFRTLSKKWRIFQPQGPARIGLLEIPMTWEGVPPPGACPREARGGASRAWPISRRRPWSRPSPPCPSW